MIERKTLRAVAFLAALLATQLATRPAPAGLLFYYDPDTGNVSLDTRGTSSGSVLIYALFVNELETSIRFRPENHVRLTQSTAYISSGLTVQEVTFGQQGSGLFTLGDILPTGLAENTWQDLFTGEESSGPGYHFYTPELGTEMRQASFAYGRPNEEFDNRWDYVDPDTLTWAQSAKLIYRQWSGEVVLDTTDPDSGYIAGYFMRSDGHFLPGNYTPPGESLISYAYPDYIEYIAGAVEPGSHSLGQILQPGLSEAEVESLLTVAKFIGRTGFGSADLDLETEGLPFSLVIQTIPEPATSLLLTTALGVLLMRRRVGLSA